MKKKFDINKISKKDEFNIPDGYFEDLHKSIEDKLKSDDKEEHDTAKVIPLNKNRRNWIIYSGIAACIALGLFVIGQNQSEDCQTFACLLEKTEITDEDIEFLEIQEGDDMFEEDNGEEYIF
ncbi:MAG: hypothetical protein ACI8YO_002661 [Gammaproteobacteria bacterium]|jgi:hypothetical protein